MPAQPMPGPPQALQQLAQHHHPYGSPLHRSETGAMLATTASTAVGLPGLAARLDPSSAAAAAYVRGPGPAIAPPPVVCAGPTAGYPLGAAACGPSLPTGPGYGQVFSFPQPPGGTLRQPWESLSSPGTAGRAAAGIHYRPSPATGVNPVIPPVYHTSTPHNHPSNPPAHHLQVGLGGLFTATPGAGPSAPAGGIGSCLPSPSRTTLGASPIIGSASSTSLPGMHGIMLGHQSTQLPIGGMHPGPSWLTDTTTIGGGGGGGGSPWHELGGEWKRWTEAGGSPGETFGSGSQSRSPSGGSGTLTGGCSGSTGTTHKRDQWL
ncbi:hypothetical protein CBR_g38897 [Chara braunii]|uniref:Uncharacterized protein n=1 Tax=Chara braunii TaxID=69332 RepID=A0A388LQL7_CHABU|nr:hypothetical protein CBR_g38897 [Chara braunii]|eukprot:GBG84614.1 hypothetical protein CBR_g38897 [Chara braunii]